MLTRIVSALTMSALIWVTSVAPASAQSAVADSAEADASPAVSASEGAVIQSAQPSAGLKDGMLKLMAEAKAGKRGPAAAPPRQPPVPRNGLSRGQKVAIGVGAAAAVIILVIVLSRGDDSDRFVAPPCPPGQLCL